MHTAYLSMLSVQGQFGVIWCISNFDDLLSTFDLNFQQSYLYGHKQHKFRLWLCYKMNSIGKLCTRICDFVYDTAFR